MQYDIFISYRRNGGEMMAHVLYERLSQKGYSVFQDIESLRSGKFNTALYEKIEQCKDVILVLSPNSLDRCANEDDWVRKEIACAIRNKKNIIPIMLRGFVWPKELPEEMDEIRFFNGIEANMEYFDQFLEKLTDYFISSSTFSNDDFKQRHVARMLVIGGIGFLGLLSPAVIVFFFHKPFDLFWRIIYFIFIVIVAKRLLYMIETRPEIAAMCFGTLTEKDLNNSPEVVFSHITSAFGNKAFVAKKTVSPFVCLYILKRMTFGSWDGIHTNYLSIQFRRTLEWYDPSVFYLHALSKDGETVKMLTRQGFVLNPCPTFLNNNIEYLVKNRFHTFLHYKKKRLDRIEIFQCNDDELIDKYDTICEVINNEKIF